MAQLSGNGRRKRHVQRKAGMRKRRNFTILGIFSRAELARGSLRGNAQAYAAVCFGFVSIGPRAVGKSARCWGWGLCLCFRLVFYSALARGAGRWRAEQGIGFSFFARMNRISAGAYSSIKSSSPAFSTFMIVPPVKPRVARKRACFARSAGVVGGSPNFLLQTSRARVSSVFFSSAPAS